MTTTTTTTWAKMSVELRNALAVLVDHLEGGAEGTADEIIAAAVCPLALIPAADLEVMRAYIERASVTSAAQAYAELA